MSKDPRQVVKFVLLCLFLLVFTIGQGYGTLMEGQHPQDTSVLMLSGDRSRN